MALYLGIKSDGTILSSDGYKLRDANDVLLSAMTSVDKWKIMINDVEYRLNINLKESE